MTQSTQPASEGRIVHVRTPGVSHCQPAIVVRAWGDGTGALNLQVIRDGSNDREDLPYQDGQGGASGTRWATSVGYSDDPEATGQTWHWPERKD